MSEGAYERGRLAKGLECALALGVLSFLGHAMVVSAASNSTISNLAMEALPVYGMPDSGIKMVRDPKYVVTYSDGTTQQFTDTTNLKIRLQGKLAYKNGSTKINFKVEQSGHAPFETSRERLGTWKLEDLAFELSNKIADPTCPAPDLSSGGAYTATRGCMDASLYSRAYIKEGSVRTSTKALLGALRVQAYNVNYPQTPGPDGTVIKALYEAP